MPIIYPVCFHDDRSGVSALPPLSTNLDASSIRCDDCSVSMAAELETDCPAPVEF